MIADINNAGPVSVRYIHWRSDISFNIAEVLCYSSKRMFKS